MKKITLALIILFVVIAGCHYTPTKNTSITPDSVKTAITKQDSTIVNPSDINYPPKLKTYYFIWSNSKNDIDPEDFVYFLNDKECMLHKTKFTYEYNGTNGIISIHHNKENQEDLEYFKTLSAADTKSHVVNVELNKLEKNFGINENINDPNFGLISMTPLGRMNYVTGYNNTYVFKLCISKKTDSDNHLNDLFNKVITNERNFLVGDLSNVESHKLEVENKMDIIKDKGVEWVNQLIKNKIDYSYESLMNTYEKLNNKERGYEKLNESIKDHYSNEEFLHTTILVDILSSFSELRTLEQDYQKFNTILDGEVLPLIQSN